MSETRESEVKRGQGMLALRTADALMRTLGGSAIVVRSPVPMAATGIAGEIGAQGSAYEEVVIEPVVVVSSSAKTQEMEVMISASAMKRAREIEEPALVEAFFLQSCGVSARGKLWRVMSVQADELGGRAYLYHVRLV